MPVHVVKLTLSLRPSVMKKGQSMVKYTFLVCRVDKLLSWFSTQTSVVNFRYYLSVQCQKAISAPWYIRHLLLFNRRPVSSCHSAAKRPYLFTCKSSIYFLSADVTASFWLALTQCRLNVVPSSMTLYQHCVRVLSCWCSLKK